MSLKNLKNDNSVLTDSSFLGKEDFVFYDISKTYEDNFSCVPCFPEYDFENVPSLKINFLGFSLNSPLGIPAGPLLNADWVAAAAKLGFDVLTYKTIRSRPVSSHPWPNMVYIDPDQLRYDGSHISEVRVLKHHLNDFENIGITNSFGVPSQSPDFILRDINKAVTGLPPGKVLIVSVMGTAVPGETQHDLIEDFVKAALIAAEAGAPIIELNFSCPNLAACSGDTYADSHFVLETVKAVVAALGNRIPVIAKLGPFHSRLSLKNILNAVAKGGGAGVCGINTVKAKVLDEFGAPFLGENRRISGICGGAIRRYALDFTKNVFEINEEEKLGLQILATGGIIRSEHFREFLNAGAHIVMTAVGMMRNPLLAIEFLREEQL